MSIADSIVRSISRPVCTAIDNIRSRILRYTSSAFYLASNYNSGYDALPNLSNLTGDAVFGANLYSTVARVYGGVGYLSGVAGNYFSTADSAAISITGDIDVCIRARLSDYTTASDNFLIGKWVAGAGLRSYGLWLMGTGASSVLRFGTSPDGSATVLALSTVAPTVSDNGLIWLRAYRDVDNGAGGNTTRFYTSTTDTNDPAQVVWTQLGADVITAGTTSIHDNATVLSIGVQGNGASDITVAGQYLYGEIRSGIDGAAVTKFNPSAVPNYSYGWRSTTGEDWLTNVSAAYDTTFQYKAQPRQLGSAGFYTNARIWGGCAFFPGTTTNYWSTPHTASYTGDTDNIAYIIPTDWTPAGYNIVAAKRPSASILENLLFINNGSTGFLAYAWSEGGVAKSASSTVATGFQDGTGAWIRATTTQNGANRDIRFYTSREHPDTDPDLINWTQLGATVSVATTTVQANSHQTDIGRDNSGNSFTGQICRYILRSSIGGPIVIDFNPALGADMATSFTSGGRVFTVTKTTGVDTNDPTRLVFSGEKYTYLTGVAGNYISCPAFATSGNMEIIFEAALSSWNTFGYAVAKNDAGLSFRLDIVNASGGSINFNGSLDGSAFGITTGNIAHGIASGERAAIKVTRNSTTGLVTIEKAATNTGPWTSLYSNTLATGDLFNTADPITVSGRNAAGAGLLTAGAIHYTKVSFAGVDHIYDARLASVSGYTDGVGTVWTHNRSASGKRLAFVDRTMCITGTDDYMTVGHHPLLNFGLTNGFTIASAFSTFGQAGDFTDVSSKGPSGTGGLWQLENRTAGDNGWILIGDGTNIAQASLTGGTVGGRKIGALVIDRAAQLLRGYINATAASTSSTSAVLAQTNTNAAQIAKAGSAASYTDLEYYGDAIFQKALTANEITALRTQLGGQA